MAKQKGILGYKADPSKAILFSFAARPGDEYPSDPDDSDYNPDNSDSCASPVQESRQFYNMRFNNNAIIRFTESNDKKTLPKMKILNGSVLKKKHKRKRKIEENGEVVKRKRKKKKKRDLIPDLDESINDMLAEEEMCDVSMDCFPLHILIQIFTFIVDTDGALPFLCRASRVCRRWLEASTYPRLWQKVDLSAAWIQSRDDTLTWLAHNRLSQCRSIDLTSWKHLTTSAVVTMAESCPHLRIINLSGCSEVSSKAVQAIADHCLQLNKINISGIAPEGLTNSSLKYLIEKVGHSLTYFKTGDGWLRSINVLLSKIALTCCNLQHFEVTNAAFSEYITINIERLQEGCPQMKVIRFINSPVRFAPATPIVQARSPGFPDLEELSITCNSHKSGVRTSLDEDAISRLLKTSTRLQTLDVRGWAFHTFRSLIHVPSPNIELLLLANNLCPVTDDFQLDLVMAKWSDSLLELDLSWNNYKESALSAALATLTESEHGSHLEVLDLAGTVVDYPSVKRIVEKCHYLRALNLSSCRSLPRGMKREYDANDIVKLRSNIDTFSTE